MSFNKVAKAWNLAVGKPVVKKEAPVTIIDIAKRVATEGGQHYPAHTKQVFYAALEAGGEALQKRDPTLTQAQAFAKFAETPERKA